MTGDQYVPVDRQSHRVEHLQNFILLTGVKPVDDDRQPRLMLREAVDGLRHLRHQLHLVLQHLQDGASVTPLLLKHSAQTLTALYRQTAGLAAKLQSERGTDLYLTPAC